MSILAVRFFAATVVALLLIVLTQGLAPRVQAAPTATFDPDPLPILDGTSADLTVTVTGPVTQEEVDNGSVRVNLIPGVGADVFQGRDAAIPAGTEAGAFVTVSVKFRLKCVDNEIEGTGEESVEFGIGFGIAAVNAIGSGTVTCSGDAIATFDPDPLDVPNGSQRKVTVTVTKLASALEVSNKKVHLRLVHPNIVDDVLLDTADVPTPQGMKPLQKITVTTTFPIDCLENEIRGRLNGTGTDSAVLKIDMDILVPKISEFGIAICVPPMVWLAPSGGSHPSSVVVDPVTGLAYVLNTFDGAIGVFDGATLINTINLCEAAPAGVSSVEPDGNFGCLLQGMYLRFVPTGFWFYATNLQTARLIVLFFGDFDTSSPSGPPEVVTIPVGAGPRGIDGDESSGQIYVANGDDGTISVIDAETNAVTKTITVGGLPWSVKVDSADGIAYVSNFTLDVVHVIDTATNTEVDTIDVGNGPTGMEIDHEAGTLWVTNFVDSTVSVVDLYTAPLAASSLTPTTIDLGAGTGPNAISLNVYTDRLYVANALKHAASVIDRMTRQVVATIDVGDTPDAVAAHGKKGIIYIANHDANTLSLISDPNPYVHRQWGDLNCDNVVDGADILASLRANGALPTTNGNGCPAFGQEVDILHGGFAPQAWGDLTCDGSLDGHDPLLMIRVFAGLDVPGGPDCPQVNSMTYVW